MRFLVLSLCYPNHGINHYEDLAPEEFKDPEVKRRVVSQIRRFQRARANFTYEEFGKLTKFQGFNDLFTQWALSQKAHKTVREELSMKLSLIHI